MKTIGLVGGLSWVSTLDYYRIINEQTNLRLGGDEAAKLVLYSVNFGQIKSLTLEGRWDRITEIISEAAKKLEDAGADCLLLGANTMHNIAEAVQAAVAIPLIHIADATATAIKHQGLDQVALLGTRYTMQLDFYKSRLLTHNIQTIIPGTQGIEMVNSAIYEELGKGILLPQTKTAFIHLIEELVKQGAQGIILGCTEIPLLIKGEDSPVPVFDTTFLHAKAAVDFALSE